MANPRPQQTRHSDMDDAELSNLVEALTPRVVEACMNRLSGSQHQQPTTSTPSQFVRRPSTSQATAHQPLANQLLPGRSTQGSENRSTPRDELRRSFSKTHKRRFHQYQRKGIATKNFKCMDVVLLPDHTWKKSPKGKERADLHRDGMIIDMFKFDKAWSEQQVVDALFNAFQVQLTADDGEPITFCIKKPVGLELVEPRVRPDECLDGGKLCEIFSKKTVYLCPDRAIKRACLETVVSSEESEGEEQETLELDPFQSSRRDRRPSRSTETPPRGDVVSCPSCTYINSASAVNCEICFGMLQEDRHTVVQCGSSSRDVDGEGSSASGRETSENPVQTLRQLTGFDNNPPQPLYVSRDTLLEDNIAFFKKKFDVTRPISVRFHGEQAIDAGGPLRENFRSLQGLLRSTELNMFYGTQSHNLLPSNNQQLLYSGLFEVLGKIISASIINGAPMTLPLHQAVIHFLLNRPREEQCDKITIEDILDVELKGFLMKILDCDQDDELTAVINEEGSPTHWLDNCGWPASKAMTVACKHEIVHCIMYNYFIGMRCAPLSAIQSGMKCGDRFPLNVIRPAQLTALLTPRPITSAEVKELVQPSVDRLKMDGSEVANYVVRLFEEIDDIEANIIAVFATAADSMYEDLKEIKLDMNKINRAETSPIANTCSASILFPSTFTSYSEFKTHVLKVMKDALDHFGMI